MQYFLHDTSSFDDEKISLLYMNFGYEGIGLFYTILEKIGKQEKPINTKVLKMQLKVGKRLEKCWKFMEEIEIIQSKNSETFNKELLNYSKNYQVKKEKNREKISDWRNKQKDTENVTSNNNSTKEVRNAPKVKETKVKETKVNIKESQDKILHAKMRAEFEQHFFNEKKIEYYWEAKDAGALKSIITKLRKATSDENNISDDEKIFEAWQAILKNIHGKWINDNLSVTLINSKYNQIVAMIVNRGQGSGLQEYSKKLKKEMTDEFE